MNGWSFGFYLTTETTSILTKWNDEDLTVSQHLCWYSVSMSPCLHTTTYWHTAACISCWSLWSTTIHGALSYTAYYSTHSYFHCLLIIVTITITTNQVTYLSSAASSCVLCCHQTMSFLSGTVIIMQARWEDAHCRMQQSAAPIQSFHLLCNLQAGKPVQCRSILQGVACELIRQLPANLQVAMQP